MELADGQKRSFRLRFSAQPPKGCAFQYRPRRFSLKMPPSGIFWRSNPLRLQARPYTLCAENRGAGGRTWTPDLLITNQLLYQLSYTSMFALDAKIIYHFTDILSTVFYKVFDEKNMQVLCLPNLLVRKAENLNNSDFIVSCYFREYWDFIL